MTKTKQATGWCIVREFPGGKTKLHPHCFATTRGRSIGKLRDSNWEDDWKVLQKKYGYSCVKVKLVVLQK